jgi:hypothetical protein
MTTAAGPREGIQVLRGARKRIKVGGRWCGTWQDKERSGDGTEEETVH